MSNELNAIELNDAELAQIQGGGFFSAVADAAKKAAEAIAKGFTNGAIAEIKRRISRWF